MIVALILIVIGIVLIILGVRICVKKEVTLLHEYHRDKVSEDDMKSFCVLSGIGVVTIGLGIVVSGFIAWITDSLYSFIPLASGFVIGLFLLIAAGMKYNR